MVKSDYVNVERPLTYFKVLDEMNERKKTVSYLSLDEVSEIANKYRVGSQGLIEEMLRFFRDLGLIMWHDEPFLRNVVILNPIKFLVSPATNIVCQHTEDEQGSVHSNETLKKACKQYFNDFEVMKKEGVVSTRLLEFILKEHIKNEEEAEEGFLKRIKAVVDLMVKYSFLVPMFDDIGEDEVTSNNPHKYLVPSLLHSHNYSEASRSIQSKFLYIYCYVGSSVTTKVFNLSQDVENSGFLPL